ncbi:methyl-accepting chemotaxis protein [Sporosarcina beigongshangi]|uniref:methyl-accepting chemotaxis protein n=1 Tax=Sporosarcina beigongshangi TaxID=2782538 RepID=UPI00193A4E73|nr:methyl-accepting chemotaxis protein [Sporosarcina beigongshangi]
MKKLETKMLLFILVPTILFFIGLGTYISLTVHSTAIQVAEESLETRGELLAEELGLELEKTTAALQTLSQSLGGLLDSGSVPARDDANTMLRQLLVTNPNAVSSWMVWEPDAFDGKDADYVDAEGHDTTGRFVPIWSKDEDGKFIVLPMKGYNRLGDLHTNLKKVLETGENALFEPVIVELNKNTIYITSVAFPVKVNGKAVGVIGVDMELKTLNELVTQFSFYDSGFASLMSNTGIVISHQQNDLIGRNYFDHTAMSESEEGEVVRNAVLQGEKIRISGISDILNKDVYRLFSPISVEGIQTPWSALLVAPLDEVTKEAKAITTQIVISIIVIVTILALIIFFVTRNITKVLRATVGFGQVLQQGDFTQSISGRFLKRKDELGDLATIFTSISDSMRSLISKVQDSAQQVEQSASAVDIVTNEATLAANEVTSAIEKVAQSAEVQMQSAEESAKAMGDMSQRVQTVAFTATTVSDTTHKMIEQANSGQKVVQNAVQQMDTIHQGTNETKLVIEQLETEANKIQNIVSVITSISEQTNLLALNAAIEAARAGTAGKGFAVVADEVRKLADETNGSAADIQKLVSAIQADTIRAADSMTKNESGVNDGIKRMGEVESAFKQIIISIELIVKEAIELSAVAEQMSASSEEIAATSEEIAGSAETSYEQTHQVAAAAEQQLASMEEITASSATLKVLSEELNIALRQFKV